MNEPMFDKPPVLRLNAWTGTELAPATITDAGLLWTSHSHQSQGKAEYRERAFTEVETWHWQSPDVSWGLVLPHKEGLSKQQLSRADDEQEPIRRLVAARGNAPVLRWRPNHGHLGGLVRYGPDGSEWPLTLVDEPGIAPWQLPRYLLIFAPPDLIPWSFQYAANLGSFVGRLWLKDDALKNYVNALLNDWADSACDVHAPLLWSVDHGHPDITWLMDQTISRKLAAVWSADKDQDFARMNNLSGVAATHARLIDTLVTTRPGLVVTSSHGMTGPLHDAPTMTAQLGLPLDRSHQTLDLQALGQRWQPDGAIWYSHACCSAGSDAVSAYDGLFEPGSDVARALGGVAAGCGARIAPLPLQLLGAPRPLRAFVGKVEPTFDWTLRDPKTKNPLAHRLVKALSARLFVGGKRLPIGWALEQLFADVGTLRAQWEDARVAATHHVPEAAERALYYQIAALDRQHTVILGDPTVALPLL
jgi:hypothetical protein